MVSRSRRREIGVMSQFLRRGRSWARHGVSFVGMTSHETRCSVFGSAASSFCSPTTLVKLIYRAEQRGLDVALRGFAHADYRIP